MGHFGYFGTVLSSFPDPGRFGTDKDPRIRISGLRLRILFFSTVAKKSQNCRNQDFSIFFGLLLGGAGYVQITDPDPGSDRPEI
jgi:hypothetical protein